MADDTNTAEREAFEAHCLRTGLSEMGLRKWGETDDVPPRMRGDYIMRIVQNAWLAFQAGRASLAASAGSEPVAAPPLQHFESPRAKILMRAWQEGWDACRDAEYVGEEAQNDAFNQSSTVNHCVAEDILYTHPSPPEGAPAGAAILCWVNEDELPEGLTQEAYSALFPHSRVDMVRMFPVFGPTAQAAPAAGAVAGPSDAGLIDLVRTFLVREDECRERENDEEDRFTDLERTQYRILRASAVQALRKAIAAAPTPAAQADSVPELAVKPACWIPPEYEGEYHRPGESITAYREPMEGWEPVYRAARAPADSVLDDAARLGLERERICAAIKAEDDYCIDHGDYMLDSDDCIKIVRGEWVRPDFSVDAARKQGGKHDNH